MLGNDFIQSVSNALLSPWGVGVSLLVVVLAVVLFRATHYVSEEEAERDFRKQLWKIRERR